MLARGRHLGGLAVLGNPLSGLLRKQCSCQVDIKWRHIQRFDLFYSEPAYFFAFQGSGVPLPSIDSVKQDDNRHSVCFAATMRECNRCQGITCNLYPQLFAQFAHKCFRWNFSRFNLSPGELPQPAMMLGERAAMHQPTPVCALQSTCNHQ